MNTTAFAQALCFWAAYYIALLQFTVGMQYPREGGSDAHCMMLQGLVEAWDDPDARRAVLRGKQLQRGAVNDARKTAAQAAAPQV